MASADTAKQGDNLMGADLASENNPDNHWGGDASPFGIPSPRPAPDDIGNVPDIGSGDAAWWYDQPRKRGSHRRYTGYVDRVSGPEGDQLRGDLAAVIRDLLDWAKKQTETSDTDNGEGGGSDDTPS
jgi:hypothetical protein